MVEVFILLNNLPLLMRHSVML